MRWRVPEDGGMEREHAEGPEPADVIVRGLYV